MEIKLHPHALERFAGATDTPEQIRKSLADSIGFLVKQLADLQQLIDEHIDKYPGLKSDPALLRSIPAVGPQVGGNMLSVMHSHHFNSAEQLAAYWGLVPVERQSGNSVLGRARLSRAGYAGIRAVLYMAAIVATRCNPHVKDLYDRLLARGKPKMPAFGAAMRKLVHLCFGVLKIRQPYECMSTITQKMLDAEDGIYVTGEPPREKGAIKKKPRIPRITSPLQRLPNQPARRATQADGVNTVGIACGSVSG